MEQARISVLFVCLGNICRSPMAHAVFEHMAASSGAAVEVDSAGTGAYHTHSPPDSRTLQTLAKHGIRDFAHPARKVRASDFTDFDYILAMDAYNLQDLKNKMSSVTAKGKGEVKAKVKLFGEYGGQGQEEIDDPYYGGVDGFEVAYDQCVRFAKAFLESELGISAES